MCGSGSYGYGFGADSGAYGFGQVRGQGAEYLGAACSDTAQAMISVPGGQFDIGNITLGPAALNAFRRGTDLKIIAAGGVYQVSVGTDWWSCRTALA